jgi:hypothetical protein
VNVASIARGALYVLSAPVLLAGCGVNPGVGAPATSRIGVDSQVKGRTFFFSGKPESFVVPANVHHINVSLRAAIGDRYILGCPHGDKGARVVAVIPVTPHEKLIVYVGGAGYGANGGFNGGGNGGSPGGRGGGGASDVRVGSGTLRDRILVAGGAGGQGGGNGQMDHHEGGCGGSGGLNGGAGSDGGYGSQRSGFGGAGGTQTAGGSGGGGGSSAHPGNPGADGARGAGGDGGNNTSSYQGAGGAGGGGGYYGGGGGGSGGGHSSSNLNSGGGGGGGSSYAERKATHVQFWSSWKNATTDGQVVFSWQ